MQLCQPRTNSSLLAPFLSITFQWQSFYPKYFGEFGVIWHVANIFHILNSTCAFEIWNRESEFKFQYLSWCTFVEILYIILSRIWLFPQRAFRLELKPVRKKSNKNWAWIFSKNLLPDIDNWTRPIVPNVQWCWQIWLRGSIISFFITDNDWLLVLMNPPSSLALRTRAFEMTQSQTLKLDQKFVP